MRDGWTGADPYPENNDEGEKFRRDLPRMVSLAMEIVLAPAADAHKYTELSRALANVVVYLADVLRQNGIVL